MSVPAQNVIPPHPGVAAQVAAAGPAVRFAPDNNTIPGNPQVQANIAAARMGQPTQPAPVNMGEDFGGDPDSEGNAQADWFGAAAVGAPTPERFTAPPTPPPAAPASQVSPQPGQQPTYSEIDALLEGIQMPGEVQVPPQAGVQPQGQPQQPVAPPSAQPQQPVPQVQVSPAAAAPAQFDAEAAQRAAIDQLMGREYSLSEVQERQLIAEPEKVIPRLAAQVHVNVVRDIGARFGQIVPQIVQTLVEQQLRGMRHETEFYSRFPKLNRPEFRPIVEQSLAMVKAGNPNITQEQLQLEGAQYAAFRIRQHYRASQPAPAVLPTRAAQSPYVPMSPGAPSVPMAPQPSNPFAELANATDLFDW